MRRSCIYRPPATSARHPASHLAGDAVQLASDEGQVLGWGGAHAQLHRTHPHCAVTLPCCLRPQSSTPSPCFKSGAHGWLAVWSRRTPWVGWVGCTPWVAMLATPGWADCPGRAFRVMQLANEYSGPRAEPEAAACFMDMPKVRGGLGGAFAPPACLAAPSFVAACLNGLCGE